MPKLKIHLSILILSLFALALPVQAETKIGSVNISLLMQEAPQAKVATDRLKESFVERERAILAEREEIRRLEENYTNASNELSRAESDALELKIREQSRELKRLQDIFTEDFSLARNEALKSIQEDVYKAIVEVAEKENYDLIVSESVLFASKRVDMTALVLERLQAITTK